MVRTKVFVGNLSFSTKENELAKEFEAAGKVISANIITRGPRSLGYGFVEMDNETDAANAVKMLDKKEIDGRPINVEVAKPREEGADNAQAANAQGNARPNNRRPRAPRSDNKGDNNGAQQQPRQNKQGGSQQNQGANAQGGRRRRSDDQSEGDQKRQGNVRRPRPTRPEGEADNRTPSTTTLFVANLPFSIEDDTFSKVLKDNNLAFKNAHVVKKRTGRSKGFGFIEFENEGDQQKALAALNNKDVDGRPLAVKVALTEIRSDDVNAPAKTSSPAPTKSSSPVPTKNANTTPAKTSSPSPAKNSSPAPTKNTTPAQSNPEKKQ